MRKIMLLMSIICLTALAAGCEENGMVVLMGDGADVSASEDACAKCGANQICMDGECKEKTTEDPCDKCTGTQTCENGACVDKPKPLCGPKDRCDGGSCKCPEEQTCENGTCKPPKCKENDFCNTCRCDAPLVCNGDNKCLKPICMDEECPPGEVCGSDGRCHTDVIDGGECKVDGDCGETEKCDVTGCVDKCFSMKCKGNEVCVHIYAKTNDGINYIRSDCNARMNKESLECNSESFGASMSMCENDKEKFECVKEGEEYKWNSVTACDEGKKCIEVRMYDGESKTFVEWIINLIELISQKVDSNHVRCV